ncbi:MAG: glucose-6-phosphate dehydrogenase [candidate division Zixibacteria bacterium]|nr:glucose-6-phosphate dehydrogenase [candidate division Zixibacteria bacterium]
MNSENARSVTLDQENTVEELTNPFRALDEEGAGTNPCAIVIFGASGDLTHRKLIPAIFALKQERLLGNNHPVIGYARRDKSDDQFRSEMSETLSEFGRFNQSDAEVRERFASELRYVRGAYDKIEDFRKLKKLLDDIALRYQTGGNVLFYLSTPPGAFGPILENLKKSGLADESGSCWRRVIVEKPIGRDRNSARELNKKIHDTFTERRVFRIDHYLGKETVQNILAFRFGNGIFEPLWSNHYIDHVQITVAESIGLGGRAGYFDTAGITRDMLQSHILQLLTLIAMEPPAAFRGEAIRDEKVKVLRSIQPYSRSDAIRNTVRAQYRAGIVDGQEVAAYVNEEGVSDNSKTETFVSLKLEIDNWRWSGVPFYIRTGKRLSRRVSQVDIVYKKPPLALFEQFGSAAPEQNVIGFRIQPDEGISLSFVSKRPGQAMKLDPVRMDFQYRTSFGGTAPEAYERLILDAINGEASLFARQDEVDLSWKLIDPLIESWSGENAAPLYYYSAGTWGPEESQALLARSGRKWRRI